MLPSTLHCSVGRFLFMAGSKEKFIYQEDSPDGTAPGRQKIVRLDESNTRALGSVPATAAAVATAGISSKVEPLAGNERYIIAQGATAGGKVFSRKLIVPDPIAPLFLAGGNITLPVLTGAANGVVENIVCQVTLAVGEVKKFAAYADTGLDDGTP